MLNVLDYSVEFPTTGRCFENRIEFAPGLTAITGRNEAGKSIVFEMIGYCLFGKAALRGLASDYKSLKASLSLMLADKDVLIERDRRKETLTVDGEVVAVGAEAINKEIPAMLGFGLDVFNIACAAQQGNLGALTEMRPTARKQMVDQLIGLDALEEVEKKCKAEAKTHQTVAESLLVSMAAPVEPVKPDDYEPSPNLDLKVREIEEQMRRREQLLAIEEPVAPQAPETLPFDDTVEELEAHEAERQAQLQEKARLEGKLAGMPEPTVSKEELQKALDYKEYQDELRRRGPRADFSVEELERFRSILSAHDCAEDEVQCPKCEHQFHLGISVEQEELLKESSPLTRREVEDQLRRHELWAEPLAEVEVFELPNIQQEINAHANATERARIVHLLGEINIGSDRSRDLRAARDHERDLAVFRERDAAYGERLRAFQAAREELVGLADRTDELRSVRERAAGARHFEGLLATYEREQERYTGLGLRVAESRKLADAFLRGATALGRVRSSIKGELAPSLGRAASSLIGLMTGGERRLVEVDEDFNIIVDGQPLQTLSGSGKSVVNLALRLGLGQVLTSRVLPIFLGDEIDADLDTNRAECLQATMQTLRDYLSQVLIITHKPELPADQTVEL